MSNRVLFAAAALVCASAATRAQTCADNVVANGDFTAGLVPGSMPGGSVDDWSLLTASPQVVTDGCDAPGAVQMWGNQVVGESIRQQLPGVGIVAGTTYRVTICYRWLDNNPTLPQYVRLRLTASGGAPVGYPPLSGNDVIGVTPNSASTVWTTYTFPNWTAPNNAAWITVNPENDHLVNDGNFVSWGLIDDICVEPIACDVVANGDFSAGLVPGSMPSGAVADWSLLTASPQVVTDGCAAPGAVQMWGNRSVGESIQQQLPGAGFEAGKTYRISLCYRWLNNNPTLPNYVGFRLTASAGPPAGYPPVSGNALIGTTPYTSSTFWASCVLPDWTPAFNYGWITINPENEFVVDDGNFVTWGQIDDLCVDEVSAPEPTPLCFGDGGGTPCPCGNAGLPGRGCNNSLGGGGALLTATGTFAVTGDTGVLTATGVPNQPGLFFQGNAAIAGGNGVTFGDGLRCCGQAVVRLVIVLGQSNCAASDGSCGLVVGGTPGPLSTNPAQTGQGAVDPGEVKCYQFWYRDPSGGPCGAGFNLTNAVSVTWGA